MELPHSSELPLLSVLSDAYHKRLVRPCYKKLMKMSYARHTRHRKRSLRLYVSLAIQNVRICLGATICET